MIEGEIIIVTIISTVGGLIGLLLVQRFWDHKWDKNFEFEKFKIKERSKQYNKRQKIKNPEPKNPISTIAKLLPVLTNLDPDQIKALADTFMGGETGEYEEEEGEDIISTILNNIPQETIQGFIEGLGKKTGDQPPAQQNY